MKKIFKSGLLFMVAGIFLIILSTLPFVRLILVASKLPDPTAVSTGVNYTPPVFLIVGLFLLIVGIIRRARKNKSSDL